MKKSIIKYVLCFTFIVSTVFCINIDALAATPITDTTGTVTWSYSTSTYTLTISGSGATADYTLENLPDWISYYKSSIRYVNVNEGVTAIGDYAFYNCTALKQILLPDSLVSIGVRAFSKNSALPSVTIPKNVKSIGNSAFSICDSLTTVNYNATQCSEMGSTTNPVFLDCSSLTEVNIGSNVKRIPQCAFEECRWIKSITIPDNVLYLDNYAFYRCTSLTTVNLNDKIATIPQQTFYECTSLVNINMPRMLTNIGERAFGKCTALESVSLSKYVTEIGPGAFENATNVILYVTEGTYAYEFADLYSINKVVTPDTGGGAVVVEPSVVTTSNFALLNGKMIIRINFDKQLTNECVHIAYYNASGNVVDYMIIPIMAADTGVYLVTNDISSAAYAKVFVWDSLKTCLPVSDPEYITIKRP